MGYWNGYSNYEEWIYLNGKEKGCLIVIVNIATSPTQKYCTIPACRDDRYFAMLWEKGKHPLQLNNPHPANSCEVKQIDKR